MANMTINKIWIDNRKRFVDLLKSSNFGAKGLVYLHGLKHEVRPGTDADLPFRQFSPFLYLSGLENENDAHLIIDLNKEDMPQCHLFLPKLPPSEIIWVGEQKSFEKYKSEGQWTSVRPLSELEDFVLKNMEPNNEIHVLPGEDQQKFSHISNLKCRVDILEECLNECRTMKSEEEIAMMKYANEISSSAHASLMKFVKTNEFRNGRVGEPTDGLSYRSESRIASEWYAQCMQKGLLMNMSYLPIVAYKENAAILHYSLNNALIPENPEGLVLVDAGAEYKGYAADITRTWPCSGKFTPKQKQIYEIVLDAQMKVLNGVKSGVEYEYLHRLATETICEGLLKIGVLRHPKYSNGMKREHDSEELKNDFDIESAVKDLCWKHFVTATFFPHGLGHLIGLDVHDVGGYSSVTKKKSDLPGLRNLRLNRTLKSGYAITVEPGCYFIPAMLEQAEADPEKNKFINWEMVYGKTGQKEHDDEPFIRIGGVRIEDCVVVTENGHLNLTTAPKTVEDIEKLMQN